MQNNKGLNREGDVNFSKDRAKWINSLDDKSKDFLKADQAIFMKQSMSTPCMDVIVNAKGCYVYDMAGKKYLDFHGNSLHQVGYKNS